MQHWWLLWGKAKNREVFVKFPTFYCSQEPYPHHCAAPESLQCCAGQRSRPLLSTLAYVSWVSAKAEQGLLKQSSLCLFHRSLDQSIRCDDCEVLWRCWGLGCILNGKFLLNEEFIWKMLVYSDDSAPLASAGIYWTSKNCLQQAWISMRYLCSLKPVCGALYTNGWRWQLSKNQYLEDFCDLFRFTSANTKGLGKYCV